MPRSYIKYIIHRMYRCSIFSIGLTILNIGLFDCLVFICTPLSLFGELVIYISHIWIKGKWEMPRQYHNMLFHHIVCVWMFCFTIAILYDQQIMYYCQGYHRGRFTRGLLWQQQGFHVIMAIVRYILVDNDVIHIVLHNKKLGNFTTTFPKCWHEWNNHK